ncbi:hypothetical protein A5780_14495 [Nocardia sp. 852002-20019_SCH5090214]|nr:hypothetical protein A5780_14495 [Nocardia sp. 852002-20019_SCH5090214]
MSAEAVNLIGPGVLSLLEWICDWVDLGSLPCLQQGREPHCIPQPGHTHTVPGAGRCERPWAES